MHASMQAFRVPLQNHFALSGKYVQFFPDFPMMFESSAQLSTMKFELRLRNQSVGQLAVIMVRRVGIATSTFS